MPNWNAKPILKQQDEYAHIELIFLYKMACVCVCVGGNHQNFKQWKSTEINTINAGIFFIKMQQWKYSFHQYQYSIFIEFRNIMKEIYIPVIV